MGTPSFAGYTPFRHATMLLRTNEATNAGGLTEQNMFDAGFISSTLGFTSNDDPKSACAESAGYPPARGTMSSTVSCPTPPPSERIPPCAVRHRHWASCSSSSSNEPTALGTWARSCVSPLGRPMYSAHTYTHGPVLPHCTVVDGLILREGRPGTVWQPTRSDAQVYWMLATRSFHFRLLPRWRPGY